MLPQFRTVVNILISPSEVINIFSNVESILLFNNHLLAQLEEELQMNESRVGRTFVRLVEFLKLYTEYVNNYRLGSGFFFFRGLSVDNFLS